MAGTRITEEDRAGASCVTSHGGGHQFEIQLGHLCNNRCVFCSSGQLTELKLAKPIALDPILSAIEEARARGARRVTFLGGEPTLHKGFLDALRRSVELGFEEIVIFTNGVLLPRPGFIDEVVALGFPFEWRISIQGGNEAAHVAVTKRAQSFRRIVEGLEILRARNQRVTANLCVNEESYRSLPDYPSLVRAHGIRQLHVDIIRPSSVGERTEDELRAMMPRYSEMAPFFARMLEGFERDDPGFDVNVGNLPYCILPEWGHRIHHGGEETVTQACDESGLQVGVDKYAWHYAMRRHPARCGECVFRPQCSGVFGEYRAMYGESEFVPLSLEGLRARDAAMHNFVLLVEPRLARLLGDPPPAGWEREELLRDAPARRIELRLRSPRGRATFRFDPPATLTEPAISKDETLVTRDYGLRLAIDPAVADEDLRALLAWAAERLEGPLEVEPVLARHRDAKLLVRGRARVLRMVAALQQRARFGEFRVAGSRDDGPGSILELRGPDGARLELRFVVAAESGRSRVTLDVRLGDGADEATARPAVAALLATLRADPATALA